MARDKAIVSKTMKAIRGKNTGIERKLRHALTEKGIRYQLYSSKVFGHPDIVLLKERIAIFADSEFWHGYRFEENEAKIATNRDYWIPKIRRNIERDEEVNDALHKEGWLILRFWGFEIEKELDRVISEILSAIEKRRHALAFKEAIQRKDHTTLGYIFDGDKVLLLYRNKKENDLNEGKYLGVGGHVELGETPLQCIKREILEETGLTPKKTEYLGKIYFLNDAYPPEVMYLYRILSYGGELIECDEGELRWVPYEEATSLPMWEGDKVFFPLLVGEKKRAFELSLVYHDNVLTDVIGPIYKKEKPKKKKGNRHGKRHD